MDMIYGAELSIRLCLKFLVHPRKLLLCFQEALHRQRSFTFSEVPEKSATEFMLVTDRRLIFCSQGIEKSKIVSFPYSAVTELIEMLRRDFIGTERFTLDSIDAK
jgi:hypothetical protein